MAEDRWPCKDNDSCHLYFNNYSVKGILYVGYPVQLCAQYLLCFMNKESEASFDLKG